MSYAAEIATALATPGGHLSLGRGGFTLHFGNARLSGYDCEAIKAEALAAGLPLIDSRTIPFELAAVLAVCGPMVAINQDPSPCPWHGFAYAPLSFVAAAYRRAGVEVVNTPTSRTPIAGSTSTRPGQWRTFFRTGFSMSGAAGTPMRERRVPAFALPINTQTPRDLGDNGWLHLMPGDSRELRMPAWLCGSSAELHP